MRVLHWFRSDLRLFDNTALNAAAAAGECLALVFVWDDRLLPGVDAEHPRVRFLTDALRSLSDALVERGHRLTILRGDTEQQLVNFTEVHAISHVFWNRDYSVVAKRRDAGVRQALENAGVNVATFKDRVVAEADELKTKSGGPFKVYTPYKNAWWKTCAPGIAVSQLPKLPPPLPHGCASSVPPSTPSTPMDAVGSAKVADMILPEASEQAAQSKLHAFLAGPACEYETLRDIPSVDGTSGLSPYLRFGLISVRDVVAQGLHAAAQYGEATGFRKWLDEIVWREFYHAILDQHPHVARGAFRPEYDAIKWDNDPALFAAWCAGRTGFPFVDAGMRQLNATGWMHNRLRMVVASFLTKDLLIDWRWGERYFMERLIDGDPASNNGGWQWSASTGTDAQPYFRIFNPTAQGERFDPEGDYIRRWLPELEGLPGRLVHRPQASPLLSADYPAPVVDHAERRQIALQRYKAARG